jgi:hypothetical protein
MKDSVLLWDGGEPFTKEKAPPKIAGFNSNYAIQFFPSTSAFPGPAFSDLRLTNFMI